MYYGNEFYNSISPLGHIFQIDLNSWEIIVSQLSPDIRESNEHFKDVAGYINDFDMKYNFYADLEYTFMNRFPCYLIANMKIGAMNNE